MRVFPSLVAGDAGSKAAMLWLICAMRAFHFASLSGSLAVTATAQLCQGDASGINIAWNLQTVMSFVSCLLKFIVHVSNYYGTVTVIYFTSAWFPTSVVEARIELTQFCALLKTMLFCRAYETPAKRLRNSLAAARTQIYLLSYLVITEGPLCRVIATEL